MVPEAFEVQPQDLRQFVDHQLFLCFGQEDRFGGGPPSSSCKEKDPTLSFTVNVD